MAVEGHYQPFNAITAAFVPILQFTELVVPAMGRQRGAETRGVARGRGIPVSRHPCDRVSGDRADAEVTLCHVSPVMRRV